MSERASNLIRYLRDCYQADRREQAILNLFGQQVEFRYFITEPDELLSGTDDQVAVEDEELLEVQATASLHRAEKELLLGAFFVAGYLREGESLRRLCAPLIYYPVEVAEGLASPVLEVDFAARTINIPLLSLLASYFDVDPLTLESFVDQLPAPPYDRDKVGHLADLMAAVFPQISTRDLLLYPEQCEEKKLRQVQRATKNSDVRLRLKCVFGSAVLLIRKSIDSGGVVAELSELAAAEVLSPPLRLVLGYSGPAVRKEKFTDRVPAILSKAQKRVLRNAARRSLSLVSGQVGTGKSLIVAAVALDALRRGESVLVASKTDHAVDVVADKIEDLLGIKSFVVRGGRKQYLKSLKDSIDQILNGVLPIPELAPAEQQRLEEELTQVDARRRKLEKALVRRSRYEQAWGRCVVRDLKEKGGLGQWIARKKVSFLDPRLRRDPPYWDLMREYQTLLDRHVRLSAQLIQAGIRNRIEQILSRSREIFVNLSQTLRARTAAHTESRYEALELEALLQAFPVWMVNLADAGTVVPMGRELFDLVIIDEATHCDVASSLPVCQRAKRAVIVGDGGQLRHLSFLSPARQERIARQVGIRAAEEALYDYQAKSLLDVVGERIRNRSRVSFLAEHFRSAPPIIAFSNREFYGGQLRTMQERPNVVASECLTYRQVRGQRNEAGANPQEAEALVAELRAMLKREQKRPPEMRHSIGILSPFKAQVELLTEMLAKVSTSHLREHDLLVGMPSAFQGQERDVMFLSLVVDPEADAAVHSFLNRADVFNVSITRACTRQVVFGSVAGNEERVSGLVRRYLEHLAAEHPPAAAAPKPASDPFRKELRKALEADGFRIWPGYPIAGFKVDLIVERDGRSLGIDLVGYPGQYAGSFELERYRLFNRAGLRIMPLPYSTWCFDRPRCLAAVASAFAETGS